MPKITSDGNGVYHVPAKLANSLLMSIFGALLTVIASILIWWFNHSLQERDWEHRLAAAEASVAREILPAADKRLTVVESQMVGINVALARIEARLSRIESSLNGDGR